ncbi:hypothetical protein FQN57_000214 [Myotisia sp. PD_48]|nr:hypothetical protein FQN57_000214 [Myotisia sp. PD_48]
MTNYNNRDDAKITLYWLEQSRSQRILWLLEELELPYELKRFKRGKNMDADPKLKKIHPLGKSPVITIESFRTEEPVVIAESGMIVEYLIEHFGPHMIPKRYKEGSEGRVGCETEAWMRYRYFMHYSEGSLMPLFLIQLTVNKIRAAPVPFFVKPVTRMIAGKIDGIFLQKNMKTHMDFLEDKINTSPGGGKYLCGDELTGADIMMCFLMQIASMCSMITKKSHPGLMKYLDTMLEREANLKAVDLIVELEVGNTDVLPQ